MGIIAAIGVLIGMLEPVGITVAGTINAFAYIAWSVWLMGGGVFLLRTRSEVVSDLAESGRR